jgi:hypothetical protein
MRLWLASGGNVDNLHALLYVSKSERAPARLGPGRRPLNGAPPELVSTWRHGQQSYECAARVHSSQVGRI